MFNIVYEGSKVDAGSEEALSLILPEIENFANIFYNLLKEPW